MNLNKIFHENCIDTMAKMSKGFVDLTVTSPPYDSLRHYEDDVHKSWGEHVWKPVLEGLYRVTKDGGVVVWVVADATLKGSETGTSFKQALYAMECGFRLHDTMIWEKPGFTATGTLAVRYASVFEYMFVFSKGKPKTFNPIKDRPKKIFPAVNQGSNRQADGTMRKKSGQGKVYDNPYSQRFNVWKMSPECNNNNRVHPAIFPEQLARDHIISWSNEGDLIYDPFMGGGTTGKMALLNNRKYIGSEISKKYVEIAEKRINQAKVKV